MLKVNKWSWGPVRNDLLQLCGKRGLNVSAHVLQIYDINKEVFNLIYSFHQIVPKLWQNSTIKLRQGL